MWWWDGAKWVPANQAPVPQPPQGPPSYYYSIPPPATSGWAPSPGLRTFLLVFLGLDAGLTGMLSLFGTLGEVQNLSQASAREDPNFVAGIIFWLVFVALFGLAIVAIVRRCPPLSMGAMGRNRGWNRDLADMPWTCARDPDHRCRGEGAPGQAGLARRNAYGFLTPVAAAVSPSAT